MAFSGAYGADIKLSNIPCQSIQKDDQILFSESNSRFIVEVPENSRKDFENLMKNSFYSMIGQVKNEQNISIYSLKEKKIIECSLDELMNSWKKLRG